MGQTVKIHNNIIKNEKFDKIHEPFKLSSIKFKFNLTDSNPNSFR